MNAELSDAIKESLIEMILDGCRAKLRRGETASERMIAVSEAVRVLLLL